MSSRLLLASLIVVGTLTTVSHGEAQLVFTGSEGYISGTDILITSGLDGDATFDVTVSLRDVGGVGFGDGGLTGINLGYPHIPDNVVVEDWNWTFDGVDNLNDWFSDGMPHPFAISFGPVFDIPAGGETELGSFRVEYTGNLELYNSVYFSISFDLEIYDENYDSFPFVGGSDQVDFYVFMVPGGRPPEPATIGMLAVSILLLPRRSHSAHT